MIEPIYKYTIDQKMLDSLRCPTCKSKLERVQLIDLFVQGLACNNNHRFYIELQTPIISVKRVKCTSMKGSIARDNMGIIKSWLTDFKLRSNLNNQLATMVRRIYEITKDNLNVAYGYDIFRYCPFCVNPLKKFEQSDIWVQGLRCNNTHEFFAREGQGIGFLFEGEYINLVEEMSNTSLLVLLKNWLKEKISRELKVQLHSQIVSVMLSFIQLQKNTKSGKI